MTCRRRLTTTGLLAALVAAAALPPAASAAAPTDPQAAAQQPLSIMRVGDALDWAGRPLADVPVLVADTGLDMTNVDIAPRLFTLQADTPAPNPEGAPNRTVLAGAHGWDLLGDTPPGTLRPDPDPSDVGGHGTAVAGLLGAAWNNGQGGAGVAPNARFVALRTCWIDDNCYQNVQASAVQWAIERGARVVSFSWLADPAETNLVPIIRANPNVLFVTIPSGNGGAVDADPDGPYPCALDAGNVLCVSTSAPDDGLDCGAYGPRSVDVAVPTQNSVTTLNGGGFGPTGCATSFASPTAAGVATILFGIDPTASAADVRAAIVDSARPAAAWQGKSVSGGIVDASTAVRLFQQRRGIPQGPGPRAPVPGPTPRDPGTPPGPGPRPAPRDTKPPVVRARLSRRQIALTLSERADVRIVVQRAAAGRRVRGACRPPARARRGAPRCTRWVDAVTLRRAGAPAGRSSIALPRRDARRRRLAAGGYRALVTATDAAGNRSHKSTVGFRVGR